MRSRWIAGVLASSLHYAALIRLNLQAQPDAVENPWRLFVAESDLPPRLLPAGMQITPVYDEADGELLILGEPGAGKTTLLLELARDLLDRAEQDPNHLIPVIFNLSSWAIGQQPLAEWLVEELNTKYRVSRKIGQEWIDTNQLISCLMVSMRWLRQLDQPASKLSMPTNRPMSLSRSLSVAAKQNTLRDQRVPHFSELWWCNL